MSVSPLDIIAHYASPITCLLTDESAFDVCVNPDGSLWVNRLGRGFEQESVMSTSDIALLLSGIATEQGCELNASHPVLETTFPLTGDRIEGLIHPVVTDSAFAIRTKAKKVHAFEDFAERKILTTCHDPQNVQGRRASFSMRLGRVLLTWRLFGFAKPRLSFCTTN